MSEEDAKKPKKGTWGTLGAKEGISFEPNKPEQVTFLTDEPEEKPSTFAEDEVYYAFSVKRLDGTESVINTSAWTLLYELKKLAPLKGKTVQITKKVDKGKNSFVVVPII